MIEIDGSMHSGSGTLLRHAVVLATLIGEPIHMFRIRAKRDKPGLRPQHLTALRAVCALGSGHLEGDELNSQEVHYFPGNVLKGGQFSWDIGTAGSTTMLAFALLPVALYANSASSFTFRGGLFQDFAPGAHHMQKVLFPLVAKMGVEARLEIIRPGYVPSGEGEIVMHVKPAKSPLEPLLLPDRGEVMRIAGISLASNLHMERVSERMAGEAQRLLGNYGYESRIESINDSSAAQKGAALTLWAATSTGCLFGSDQAGKRGRRSEKIAKFVVDSLLEDMGTGATTDRHVADQLILFAALGRDRSEYVIPSITDHVESNMWLVRKIIGAKTDVQGNRLRIEGIGICPSRA